MRYVAAVTTKLPDGRIIMEGEEYDYPKGESESSPDTISELAQEIYEKDQEQLAILNGEELPPRRGPGRPRKVQID